MKKILASLLLLSVAVGYADGQTALTGNKFADNWAIVSMRGERLH